MHSHLREQVTFEPVIAPSAQSFLTHSTPPQKKQKMSITQTYYLAHTARGKLSRQASRGDHDLRLLVGHANLLDTLMSELQDAERQQEAWFNQAVSKASHEEPKRMQWADTIVEDPEDNCDDDAASDTSDSSDSDSEDEVKDIMKAAGLITTAPRMASHPSHVIVSSIEVEEDEEVYDDEYDEDLVLTRVSSRSNPPELTQDSDDSSDDESPPASPPAPATERSQHQNRKGMDPSGFFPNEVVEDTLEHDDLTDTRRHGATMIAAY